MIYRVEGSNHDSLDLTNGHGVAEYCEFIEVFVGPRQRMRGEIFNTGRFSPREAAAAASRQVPDTLAMSEGQAIEPGLGVGLIDSRTSQSSPLGFRAVGPRHRRRARPKRFWTPVAIAGEVVWVSRTWCQKVR